MYFGQYAFLEPIDYRFEKEQELSWLIEPPTSGDELAIARFLNQGKVTISIDGTSREAPPTWLEVAYREIALTFGGTNIPKSDSNDTPILKKHATVTEVENVPKKMPHAMVMELWNAIKEFIPGWGPKEVKTTTTED